MTDKHKITFYITNEGESEFPAMGAFAMGTMKEGQPLIQFNLEAIIEHSKDESISLRD